jgi:hypothetical protein
MLAQAVAAQLNIDNHIVQPNNLIDEAVMWLTSKDSWAGAGVNVDGDNDGIVDEVGGKLKGASVGTDAASAAWSKYVEVGVFDVNSTPGDTTDDLHVKADGEGLKNALMWFNDGHLVTSGVYGGSDGNVAYFDGTFHHEHANTLDNFWLTLHEQGGLQGIA